jgi:predicted HTH domain antitoxin
MICKEKETMFPNTTISRTDLARHTRQALEKARRGQTVLVESYGEEQVAIVDALDYRLLRAAALYQARRDVPAHDAKAVPEGLSEEAVETAVAQAQGDTQVAWNLVVTTYLDGHISLGRAANLLNVSRFDLTARFNRLGLPLRIGPATVEEARAEMDALADETL